MKCCVTGCFSETGQGIYFGTLPKEKNRRNKWLTALGRDNWNPANAIVCEFHFSNDDFERLRKDGKKKLKVSAVPVIESIDDKENIPMLKEEHLPIRRKKRLKSLAVDDKENVSNPNVKAAQDHFYSKPTSWHPVNNPFIKGQAFIKKESQVSRKIEETEKANIENEPMENRSCHPFSDSSNYVEAINSSQKEKFQTTNFPEHSYTKKFNAQSERRPAVNTRVAQIANEHNYAKRNDPFAICQPFKDGVDVQGKDLDCDSREKIRTDDCNELNAVCEPLNIISNKKENVPCEADTVQDGETLPELISLRKELDKEIAATIKVKEKDVEITGKFIPLAEKLMKQNIYLRRKLASEQKARGRLQKRLELTEANVSKILSPTQFKAIGQNSTRGLKWADEDIETGLSLKSKCGSTGYSEVAKRFVCPSVRSLNERIEHIKFVSGILDEVFARLKVEVAAMNDKEKNGMLAMDEIAIRANDKIVDPSTRKPIGGCTLPGHTGAANKALVVAIAGLNTRWKQTVAYYFTKAKDKEIPKALNVVGQALKNICEQVIIKCENVGLKMHVVTNDMGPDNRAMWKAFGVKANRKEIISSIPNPARPGSFIYFMADVPHLFKRMKLMFTKKKYIFLPDDIVKEYQLPSNLVNLEHLETLVEYEKENELKVAFRLKESELKEVGQYEKMKMAGARSVLCHRTYVGLKLLSEIDPTMTTTAWFVDLVNKWFDLMTSRSPALAFCLRNKAVYDKRIAHLKLTIRVFQNMKVGVTGKWHPVQTGVLISTTSVLLLQELFLVRLGFYFFLTARLTQDFLENLFSMVRAKGPLPTALQFKFILRDITVSRKCCGATRGSNYELDEGAMLSSMLSYTKEQASRAKPVEKNVSELVVPILSDNDIYIFSDWELSVIYDVAGSALLYAVNLHKIHGCDCISSLLWQEEIPHPFATVTMTKNYTEGAQVEISNEVFVAVAKSEIIFRILREELFQSQSVIVDALMTATEYVWEFFDTPTCHDLKKWFRESYFKMRLKHYRQIKNKEPLGDVAFSSRSLGMREMTKNVILRQK